MKIVGFFHNWSGDGKLTSPYHMIVEALKKRGAEIHIIWANELLDRTPISAKSDFLAPGADTFTFASTMSEEKIVAFIDRIQPDLVLSINNGGLSERIRDGINCPVAIWLFDDFPHFFFHDGIEKLSSLFRPQDTVLCYSNNLKEQVLRHYPALQGKVHFVPHATEFTPQPGAEIKYPISFVGSCLDWQLFVNVVALRAQALGPQTLTALLCAMDRLRKDYNEDFEKTVRELKLEPLLEKIGGNFLELKRMMSDSLSTEDRVKSLDAIADLGLALFGGPNWLYTLPFTPQLAKAFRADFPVKSQADLAEVYRRSKISVDIPNVQNVRALSARVFDVMASPSLLIMEYQAGSDAFELFGADCPIPMYRDRAHLRELCQYYLTHEEERLAKVKACNTLVNSGYDYDSRIARVLELSNVTAAGGAGSQVLVDSRRFRKDIGPSEHFVLGPLRSLMKIILPYPVRARFRALLARI